MIHPYSEKQVSEGAISCGVSSYGYDLRVADEFKIFTNVQSTIVGPKLRVAGLNADGRMLSASASRPRLP
jgi:deoxycytidine triphosphate deaminase